MLTAVSCLGFPNKLGDTDKSFRQSIICSTVSREDWQGGKEFDQYSVVHRYLKCQPFPGGREVLLAHVSHFSPYWQETLGDFVLVHGLRLDPEDQFVELSTIHPKVLTLNPVRSCDKKHSGCRCLGSKKHYVVLNFTSA